jgi:hypothetical protein
MRATLTALLLAAGISVVGVSGSSAAPTLGGLLAIQSAVDDASPVVNVRWHGRWHGRWHRWHCRRHHHWHSRWHRHCWRW